METRKQLFKAANAYLHEERGLKKAIDELDSYGSARVYGEDLVEAQRAKLKAADVDLYESAKRFVESWFVVPN